MPVAGGRVVIPQRLPRLPAQSGRNCIFNIYHKGTNPVKGSACVVDLVKRMLAAKASGVALKGGQKGPGKSAAMARPQGRALGLVLVTSPSA